MHTNEDQWADKYLIDLAKYQSVWTNAIFFMQVMFFAYANIFA